MICQIIQKYKTSYRTIKENVHDDNDVIIKLAKNHYKRFHAKPWWEIVWPEDSSNLKEKETLATTVYNLSLESFTLLKKAILYIEKEETQRRYDKEQDAIIITENIFDSLLVFSLNIFILLSISKELTLALIVYATLVSSLLLFASRKLFKLN